MTNDTYYWTCPYCKANLDPGERCDCRDNDADVNNYKTVYERKGDDKNVSKADT